jgi:hypothetical protein
VDIIIFILGLQQTIGKPCINIKYHSDEVVFDMEGLVEVQKGFVLPSLLPFGVFALFKN